MSLESPAIGEEFFDREDEINSILEYIRRGEHIVIFGLRKVGKTSIIFRVGDILSDTYYVFYYYVPETKNFTIFFDEIKENFLAMLADSIEPSRALEIIADMFPQITADVARLIQLKAKPQNFRVMLQFVDAIMGKIGKRLVFVLDEFQNIVGIEKSLMDYIRQAIWTTKNTVFVFCGSAIRMIEDILAGDSSIQGIRRMKIRPFSFEKAREFIIRLSKKAIGETHISFLYYLTGGMPFHIKAIIKTLNAMPIEKVSWRALTLALEEELFRDTGVLYNYYSTLETKLRSKSPLYLEILYQIARGKRRLSQVAGALNKEPQDINHYVRRLREMDIIDENNVIIDMLFAVWLQTTWYLKNKVPTIRLKQKYRAFKDRISEIIKTYKTYLGYTVEVIIHELFKRFDNRKISTGEILPKFDLVIPNAKFDHEEVDLVAIKNKEAWAIEVKTKPISQRDIVEFYEKTLKIPYKTTKRVIIALQTVSLEAIKKAEELGIEIWTKPKIVMLLRIYNIPITKLFL